jgi:hypothetical protein
VAYVTRVAIFIRRRNMEVVSKLEIFYSTMAMILSQIYVLASLNAS